MADFVEAATKRDLQNGQGGKAEQFLRGFQTSVEQHLTKSLPATLAHNMRGPVFAELQFRGKIAQTNGLGVVGFDIAPDQRASPNEKHVGDCFERVAARRVRPFPLPGPRAKPGGKLQEMLQDKIGFRLVDRRRQRSAIVPRRPIPTGERFSMRRIEVRTGNPDPGEENPFQLKIVKDGRHPFDQPGMTDMITAFAAVVDIGPYLKNLKKRAPLLATIGLNAFAERVPVLKAITADS